MLAPYPLVIKDNAGRVDDPQPGLELNRMQILRMSRLPRHRAHLPYRVVLNKMTRKKKKPADLGTLERVNQAALADIRETDYADGHALRRTWPVRFKQAEERRSSARGEVRALMRARGAKQQRWSRVTEMLQPSLCILPRY